IDTVGCFGEEGAETKTRGARTPNLSAQPVRGRKEVMDRIEFAVSWDYRCPFARNFHEHVAVALQAGAPWDVTWWPFSLNQVHVAEGEPDVWEDPSKAPGLLAMQVGITVRDRWPEAFLPVHLGLFAARHDEGLDIREEDRKST